MKMPLATFEGAIRVGQEKAVIAEEITLTFGYVESDTRTDRMSGVTQPARNGEEAPSAPPPLRAAINS